eukprot:gene18944-22638_t
MGARFSQQRGERRQVVDAGPPGAGPTSCAEPTSSDTEKDVLPKFPTPFNRDWHYSRLSRIHTLLESKVARLEGAICDKPLWWEKVNDPAVVAVWAREAAPVIAAECPWLFDFALAELRWKAAQWSAGPSRPSAVEGVFAADGLLSEQQLAALSRGAKQLESLQADRPDWHPGSNKTVRDLVHPSLYCFRRGVTAEREAARPLYEMRRLDDWDGFFGGGTPISRSSPVAPTERFLRSDEWRLHRGFFFGSERGLVWLPAEFDVAEDGATRIASYINNLHPRQFPQLYAIIEDAFSAALPLLNDALTAALARNETVSCGKMRAVVPAAHVPQMPHYRRMQIAHDTHTGKEGATYIPYTCPEWVNSKGESTEHHYDSDDDDDDVAGGRPQLLYPVTPAAADFVAPSAPADVVDLRGRRLQVIVKMANIELTPEQPEYPGGAWHVEGMKDEGIVASAIYYYSEKNVTPSRLAFRVAVDDPPYEQGDNQGVAEIYGMYSEEPLCQIRGACTTLEGRCLAWANTLQHQVQPFRLMDPSVGGFRKILCFFLVNPRQRINSTANCPPQQLEWLKMELRMIFRLPSHLIDKIASLACEQHTSTGSAVPEVSVATAAKRKRSGWWSNFQGRPSFNFQGTPSAATEATSDEVPQGPIMNLEQAKVVRQLLMEERA